MKEIKRFVTEVYAFTCNHVHKKTPSKQKHFPQFFI